MSNAIAVLDRIDTDVVRDTQRRIVAFHALLQTLLVKDVDYGVIPSVGKPTLLKPGAEKIAMELGLAPHFTVSQRMLDLATGFIRYEVLCSLLHGGETICQAIGSCSSFETRYRYAWVSEAEASTIGAETTVVRKDNSGRTRVRIQRSDMMDVDNTLLKMAQKRAFVSAVLSVAALSNLFTADVEEMQAVIRTEASVAAPTVDTSADDAGAFVVRFGTKHKGETLAQIARTDRSYLEWLQDKATSPEIRSAVRRFLSGGTPKTGIRTPVTPDVKAAAPADDDNTALPFDL